MASLINLRSQQKISLRTHHIFGRQPDTSTTQILSPDVSRTHATIAWEGTRWRIKDTSTNGTFLNGARLPAGIYRDLMVNDTIQFGSQEGDSWQVASLDEPKCMLMPMHPHLERIELNELCALPSENNPLCVIYPSGEKWIYEADGHSHVLTTGDVVGTAEHQWRYIDARPTLATRNCAPSPIVHQPVDVQFQFCVSQNEEHVSLKVALNHRLIDLGERSHHYLLLLLARKRLADKIQGISDSEQGWLAKEELSRMLGLQENHINIQVFRFRKQITETLPDVPALHQTVARRTGALRIDYDNIVIEGGCEAMQKLEVTGALI